MPDQSAPAANTVAIRTKLGIPVFVRPAKPVRTAVIDGVSVVGGKVLTRVKNTGNLHINVETSRSRAPARQRIDIQQRRSWLVRAAGRDANLRSADDRGGMQIDDRRGRRSVRPQHVAQGREPGVSGCVRRSLEPDRRGGCARATPAAAQERRIWALVVNEEPKGDIDVLLMPDGPWVDPAALLAAGLHSLPEGRRRCSRRNTVARVAMASLAPLVNFQLDEAEIRLRGFRRPVADEPTEVAISLAAAARMEGHSNPAIFLNYSANWSTDDTTTGYGELGVRLFGTLFESAASVDEAGVVTPGLTNFTFDQVNGRRRWVLGDTIGRSTSLGSSPVVGGFSLSTQQDLDPYYSIYPPPQIRGAVRTPSIADVYVDGRLVSSVRLPPGQFTLSDLPIETGFGNARVIIRDAFGREQSINLGFYLSTQLLKRGEQDYSYVGGLERTSTGTKVEYGRAMGTAVHNIGLADWLTVGFQAEGAKDLVMGGLGFHAKLWRLGTFGAEGLVSQVPPTGEGLCRDRRLFLPFELVQHRNARDVDRAEVPEPVSLAGRPGTGQRRRVDQRSARLVWCAHRRRHAGRSGSAPGAHLTNQSGLPRTHPRFAEETSAGCARDPARQIVESELQPEHHVTLTAVAQRDPRREGGGADHVGGLCLADLYSRLAHHCQRGDDGRQGRRGVDVRQRPAIVAAWARLWFPHRRRRPGAVPVARAYSKCRAGAASSACAPMVLRTTRRSATVNLAGSIVGIGGEVLLSRPVDDGFALVKMPNSRGVRVLANNQLSGRTGRRGSLFVPDLRSYLSSPIGIVQDDLPVEVKLGAITKEIAVPYRGGAVVTFEATIIRALTGRLDVGGAAPEYGTLSVTVGGTEFSSPLNATGEFYFEDLPPGDHPGVATWKRSHVPGDDSHAGQGAADDRCRRGDVRGGARNDNSSIAIDCPGGSGVADRRSSDCRSRDSIRTA